MDRPAFGQCSLRTSHRPGTTASALHTAHAKYSQVGGNSDGKAEVQSPRNLP